MSGTGTTTRDGTPTSRLPLLRPLKGRWVGGVCAGLAAHLGISLPLLRALVLVLAATGAGVVVYVFLWVTVPPGDPARAAAEQLPADQRRLASRPRLDPKNVPVKDIAIGLIALAGAAMLVADRLGATIEARWAFPVLVAVAGLALAWSQLDRTARARWVSSGRTPVSVLRLAGGVVLAAAGVLLLVSQGTSMTTTLNAAVAALAVLLGVALVLAPWWLRLVRELTEERAARAREAERADIAAHLHDSVLQTLALIRKQAGNAEEVARIARAQERELRTWLYDDRSAPGTSLAADLAAVVAEVEDLEAVAVETVVVGDRTPDEDTAALLLATREALLNATRHGKPPVTVYLEVMEDGVEVFVRDRGEGFDLDDVPVDRFGVRESILGRVRRRGGTAELVSTPGQGTEVRLSVPVRAGDEEG